MRFIKLADQIEGQEPDDQVRSFVFMSNLAAQEASGDPDISVSAERIAADLAGSTEMTSILFSVTEDPPDAEWIESAGWVKINLPLIDDVHTASLDIVMDADHQPMPGERLSAQSTMLIDALLHQGERFAGAAPWGRHIFHTAHMHPAGEGSSECDYCAILTAQGYQLAHEEIQHTLPVLPKPWDSQGLKVHNIVGTSFPPHLMESIVELQNLAAFDVPHGSLEIAPAEWTPERLAEQSRRIEKLGTEVFTTIFADDHGAIALSTVSIPPGSNPNVAEQGLTIVHPRSRGRGLGTAVKLASLSHLATERPRKRRVATSNAVDNHAMLAINRALGAREISRTALWEKRI